jgi:hypothetical protein
MKALSLVFGCCVLMLTATAFGQATMYTVPAEITASAGDIIAFDIMTDSSNGSAVRAWQTWFDCFSPACTDDAPCSCGGTVEYVLTPKPCTAFFDCCPNPANCACIDGFCDTALAGPIVDDARADYIFFGISAQVPTENIGVCDADPYDPFTDGPRAANAANNAWEYPIVSTPKYLATWHFEVSADACGDFVLDWYCDANDGCSGDRTALLDGSNAPITPLVSTPIIVHIPCGQCCDGTVCLGEMCEQDCAASWTAGKTCADPCQCTSNADCNDGNPCTIDTCNTGTGVCSNVDVDCSGEGDVCNTASCDPAGMNGNCDILTALADGTACTNDGDPCTTDECIAGVCEHTPIEDCALVVCLNAEEVTGGAVGCVPVGSDVLVRAHIGGSSGLVGHQARVEWDTASLTLLDIQPGAFCDPTSEFTGFLNPPIMGDGWVFFAAETGVPVTCAIDDDCAAYQTCDTVAGLCTPVADASDGDVDTACLYFSMSGCDPAEVCFCEHNNDYDAQACNPYKMRIVNDTGGQLPWQPCDPPCADITPDSPIGLVCPDDVNVNADCDDVTADVMWDAPVATDECGDAAITSYTCTPLAGSPACQQAWIDNNGGTFPQGSWLFQVCAMDAECLDEICCSWTVTVSSDQTLEVQVQLSPLMADGPFTRCIEFQLWTACTPLIVGAPFYEEMTFGGDYYVAGHGVATIKIPKGQYECIAARDPLHTLRASSGVECDGVVYRSIFKGDPFLGGNWLIGGNLDGLRPKEQGSPNTIDIVDYAIFVSQFLTNVGADTDCTPAMLDPNFMHADVNGDGFVNDLDFTFISINFLESDKDTCCPDGRVAPVGLTEVTTRQLRAWGIDDKADINGDGLVNTEDMQLFLGGALDKGTRSGR